MSSGARFLALGAACIVGLLVLQRIVRSNPRERNYELFTAMVYSAAAESQAPSAVLPDGRTWQPLVEGVVVRGRPPLRFGPGDDEAARAGRELANPFAADGDEVLARGAEVYGIFCSVCHGANGSTPGPVVVPSMPPPPGFTRANALS